MKKILNINSEHVMGRKTRTSNGSRIDGERTTISVSNNVKNTLSMLTNYLEVEYSKRTGKKLGLIVNDSIKFLINTARQRLDLELPEFKLDFLNDGE